MTERIGQWSATFEIPREPVRIKGSGGGIRYQLDIAALVLHKNREKEIFVSCQDKSKSKVGDKVSRQCLLSILDFIGSVLVDPLTDEEKSKIEEQFMTLFMEEANKQDKRAIDI